MKIKEVSQLTQLSADTIRYYEKIGLLPRVERNAAGLREFHQTDIEVLQFLRCFRQAGMSLDSLSAYMQLVREGDDSIARRLDLLSKERERLAENLQDLQAALDLLDYKIKHYQEQIIPKEQRLFPKD